MLIGLTLVVWSVFTRAVVILEPLPGWDADPFAQVSAITGLGPAGSAILDVVACVGAALTVFVGRGRMSKLAWLALGGCVLVTARGVWLDWDHAEAARQTSAWIAGWASCVCGLSVARDHVARRLVIAGLIGFAGVILAKGAVQIAIELPQTVAQFEADPGAVLAARGLEPGSAAAMQFERRLRQPDLTAWFGLSNVVAAVLVSLAAIIVVSLSERRRVARTSSWIAGAVIALFMVLGVLLTGSKAGPAVLVAVLAAVFIGRCLPRSLAAVLGLGVAMLPVIAIAARGLLDWPSGERSLLFRWHYLTTGWEIVLSDGIVGVGVDGFRQAYMLAKPLESPESVTSTHHAALDVATMLGGASWLWIGALAGITWVSARRLSVTSRGQTSMPVAGPMRCVTLLLAGWIAVPALLSAVMEARATTIELAVARLLGVAACVGIAVCVWRLRPSRAAIAAGGLALVAHSQIDMVLFLSASAPMALLLMGVAAGPAHTRAKPRGGRTIAGLGLLLIAAFLGVGAWRAAVFEGHLRAAFGSAQTSAEAGLALPEGTKLTRADALAVDSTIAQQAEMARSEIALAGGMYPGDERLPQELARISLTTADARARLGRVADARADVLAAVEAAEDAVRRKRTAGTLGLLGSVCWGAADRLGNAELRTQAIDAWQEASGLDPAGPAMPARAAEGLLTIGDRSGARTWALEALRRHDLVSALDPLAGLSKRRLAVLRSAAADDPNP